MANLTPKTGDFYMFKPIGVSTEDNSLESAILLTIPSALRPTTIKNFGSLISNIPNYDLIHGSYGTKGSVPNSMGQLRGYPKPTIDINYNLTETDSTIYVASPFSLIKQTYQELWVQPVLNNIVGYDITLTLVIDQSAGLVIGDPADATVTCTFKFDKGYTYPITTTGTSGSSLTGANKIWKVNSLDPATVEDVVSFDSVASTDQDAYYSPVTSGVYTDSLSYSETIVGKEVVELVSSGSACTSVGSGTSTTIYHIPNGVLADGMEVWTDTSLTAHLSDGNYIYDYIGIGDFKYFTASSGFVISQGACVP